MLTGQFDGNFQVDGKQINVKIKTSKLEEAYSMFKIKAIIPAIVQDINKMFVFFLSESREAFVTLATNDTYSLGCLVLGSSLRRVGTTRQLVCMITEGVSNPMRYCTIHFNPYLPGYTVLTYHFFRDHLYSLSGEGIEILV